ncbi:unnamed protein product [Brassica napus]|nr:unnamed protein product [Brassica napus]
MHSLSKNESEIEKHRSNKERLILLEVTLEHSLLARYFDVDANKSVIQEHLKLKENALEASSKMFIGKENDLNNQIEELETQLNQISPNGLKTRESLHVTEADIALQNREVLSLNKSVDLEDLVNEVASLKEQNGLMEMELKEMQERYSEISVRFAEVEGERERLVMTVRNVKNAKRS